MDFGTSGGKTTSLPASDGPVDLRAPAPSADLAGALHEVSNALTVILGWIERARGEGSPAIKREPNDANDSDASAAQALDIAAARARQARDIVRRAIGAQVPADSPHPMALLVSDALLGLEPEARRGAVTFESSVHPDARSIVVPDPSAVLQILTNLLLNAISVSSAGGVVRLDARTASNGAGVDGAVFGVEDEGPGIPAERRPTLFNAGISTREGGAGIGLRHAAALATSLGGELALVDSPRGARFELKWPTLAGSTVTEKPQLAAAMRALSGARILVVEDDHAVVDLLDMALSARGADVTSVRRRSDLKGALASGPFQAALFDLSPIQDDIVGAFHAVRGASPLARLIVMSGSSVALPPLPSSYQAAWVRKPFEIDEIVRALVGQGVMRSG